MPMDEAACRGDLFITVTGCEDVITERHFRQMKDGALLSNAGHFNVEVNASQLERMAKKRWVARNHIMAYDIGGKTLFLLAEGRLVNLAAGDGHPAEIMDLSFALQALSVKYLLDHKGRLKNQVYTLPARVDRRVARLKLDAMGIHIDTLTDAQKRYMYGDAYEDPDQ
jgi:adenosylhomocysteinase